MTRAQIEALIAALQVDAGAGRRLAAQLRQREGERLLALRALEARMELAEQQVEDLIGDSPMWTSRLRSAQAAAAVLEEHGHAALAEAVRRLGTPPDGCLTVAGALSRLRGDLAEEEIK